MEASDHGMPIQQRKFSICDYAPIELSAPDTEALKRCILSKIVIIW